MKTDVEAPSGAPAPSFRDAQDAATNASAERLRALAEKVGVEVEVPPDEQPAAPVEEPPAPEEGADAYKAWYEGLPENYRTQLITNVVNNHAAQLAEKFGPEVSSLLAEIDADPSLKKIFNSLSDKKKREFLLDTALPIYEDPRFAAPAASDGEVPESPQVAALAKKVEELESKTAKEKAERDYQAYQAARAQEYTALFNTYPELRFDQMDSPRAKFVAAVIERAEEKSQKTGRIVSYADSYQELKTLSDWQKDNPPPRAVPDVSSKSPASAARPQAPKNKVEVKSAIQRDLDKMGSISHLAAALRK